MLSDVHAFKQLAQFHPQIFQDSCVTVTSGGFKGDASPSISLNITCIWIIINLFEKSNRWTLNRPCDCNIISKAMGGGGGRKMLVLQQTFYKTEISLLQIRLNWKRQIIKICNLHFSAIKAYEHNGSLIMTRFFSNLLQYSSAV